MTRLSKSLALAAPVVTAFALITRPVPAHAVSLARAAAAAINRQDQSAWFGPVHILKNCASYTGAAGSECTITSSNLPEIPAGSIVHYTEAFGILNPAWLDSNVVLDAGNGNKAVGRCTVDFSITTPGVCTFQDGTGQLAGFTARVNVSTSTNSSGDYTWDGTYRFTPLPREER
jgi:hypothetical protein